MKRMLKREQIPSVPEYECAGHVRVCLCVSLTVMIQRGCSLYSTFIRLINENSLKPHIDLHLLLLVLRQPPLSLVSASILHLFLLTFSQFTYNSHSFSQYCKGQSNWKQNPLKYLIIPDTITLIQPSTNAHLPTGYANIHTWTNFPLTHYKMIKKLMLNIMHIQYILCHIDFVLKYFNLGWYTTHF